ncbi:MAG: hypothetical protein JWM87_3534 [Candidatus Eremiobacteraeota bacterium]|nr:hypothetical protein [Candidatus Eremiobacteraeota bacterium]
MHDSARPRGGHDVHGLTIRQLIESRWFKGPSADRMSGIGATTIDGRPLADEPYYMRTPASHEMRLAPKHAELITVASVLFDIGERRVALRVYERPDFLATLHDGRNIGIEHTEVNPSAADDSALAELNNSLKAAVDAEPDLVPANSLLAFSFGPWVQHVPGTREREALVDEILQTLRTGAWTDFQRSTDGVRLRAARRDSLVDRYGLVVHVGRVNGARLVQFHGNASVFNPEGLVAPALKRLVDKIAKAHGYRMRPLWLVLALTDRPGLYGDSVRALVRLRPSIAPFERVIVTDMLTTEVTE